MCHCSCDIGESRLGIYARIRAYNQTASVFTNADDVDQQRFHAASIASSHHAITEHGGILLTFRAIEFTKWDILLPMPGSRSCAARDVRGVENTSMDAVNEAV